MNKILTFVLLFLFFHLQTPAKRILYKAEILVAEKKLIAPSLLEEGEELSRPMGSKQEALKSTEKILKYADNSKIQYTNKEGIQFSNNKAEIAFESKDDSSGIDYIEYSLNESGYKLYTVPILLSRKGTNTIKYRSIDKTGNTEDANLLEIIVDTTPPLLFSKIEGNNFLKDGMLYYEPNSKLILSAHDGESGVKDVYVNLNNEGFLPKSFLDLKFSESGYYTIHAIALDQVSNKSETISHRFSIDSDPPQASLQITEKVFKKGSPICSKKSKISLYATDRDSGVRFIQYRLLPSEAWTIYGGTFSVENLPEINLEYKAIDNVGNVSEVLSYSCPIDIEPPKTKMEIKKDGK